MKKLFYSLFALMTIVACTDDGGVDNSGGDNNGGDSPSQSITLSASSLSIASDHLEATISFTSTTAWSAEVIEGSDWCTINPTSGAAGSAKITVTTVANESYEDRSAIVVIKAGDIEKSVTIKQIGTNISELLEKEREALIAFYEATGGDNWTNNTNWCSDKPVSEWYGVSSTREDNRVTWIYLPDNNLKGKINNELNALSNLEELSIFGNEITSIELEKNENLKFLHCWDNKISKLEISNNKRLTHLVCGNNAIETLNVSENTELTEIACDNNNIQSLDLSQNIILSNLSCGNNKLSTLDLSNNIELTSVSCGYNPISTIDVSKNKKLEEFHCFDTQIKSLNFSNNPKLRILQCADNKYLEVIDVSNNIDIEIVVCSNCQNLSSLDVSNNTKLKHLICSRCNLSTLDVSKCNLLEILQCNNNHLTDLNVSNNPFITELWCGNSQSQPNGNNLTSLDLSANRDLQRFSCYSMSIQQLDISKNPKLTGFECSFNPIGAIDFSNNLSLEEIYVADTGLDYINVGHLPNLTILECGRNNINTIDVTANYKLKWLLCPETQISSIDISYNPYINWIAAYNNPQLETIYVTDYQNIRYDVDDQVQFVIKSGADNPYDKFYTSTDYSQDGIVTTLQTAAKGKGIDVILMGDGYSDRLIADGTYDKVMNTAMEKFFTEEPYKSFRDYFNVYSITAISKNEGFATGYEDTCFSSWLAGGGDTHVAGNDQKVLSYAQRVFGDDDERMDNATIIVMMNSTIYAGTCYMYGPSEGDWGDGVSISYFPVGTDDTALAQVLNHEACGHGFSKLGDEYAYEEMGVIPGSAIAEAQMLGEYGWYKNIDFTSDPTQVKWYYFLTDQRYAGEGLGVYEGAFTYWTGAYRPTYNSIMNTNVGGFNAPSREAIYYRIHKLAYGADWQYDYEEFVEWDARNRVTSSTTRGIPYRLDIPEDFQPLHPPVVIKGSWRDAKNNAPTKPKVEKRSQNTPSKSQLSATTALRNGTVRVITLDESGRKKIVQSKSQK